MCSAFACGLRGLSYLVKVSVLLCFLLVLIKHLFSPLKSLFRQNAFGYIGQVGIARALSLSPLFFCVMTRQVSQRRPQKQSILCPRVGHAVLTVVRVLVFGLLGSSLLFLLLPVVIFFLSWSAFMSGGVHPLSLFFFKHFLLSRRMNSFTRWTLA